MPNCFGTSSTIHVFIYLRKLVHIMQSEVGSLEKLQTAHTLHSQYYNLENEMQLNAAGGMQKCAYICVYLSTIVHKFLQMTRRIHFRLLQFHYAVILSCTIHRYSHSYVIGMMHIRYNKL